MQLSLVKMDAGCAKINFAAHAKWWRLSLCCLFLALLEVSVQAKPGDASFNGILLEDGDIFITRCQTILSSLYAKYGPTPGTFSHSAIFFHDRQGKPTVLHVQFNPSTIDLEQFTSTYRQIALLRAKLTTQQQNRLKETLCTWAANPIIRKARFDHTMKDVPGQRENFYCVGLINEIWRSSELPPPFVNQQQPIRTTFISVLETDLGFDLGNIISPNTILQNPGFSLLSEWHNPEYTEHSKFILDQVSSVIGTYVEMGYSGQQPGWLSGLVRRSAARIKGYSANADRAMYLVALTRAYYRKVCDGYFFLQHRGRVPEPCSEEDVALIRALCDHYRDDYFTKICQVSQTGAVYSPAVAE